LSLGEPKFTLYVFPIYGVALFRKYMLAG